jgi:hypothetical protein
VGRATSAHIAALASRMLVLTRVMMTMLSILSIELSVEAAVYQSINLFITHYYTSYLVLLLLQSSSGVLLMLLLHLLLLRLLLLSRERVLFIGTQFSILYTSMYSPAEAATSRA